MAEWSDLGRAVGIARGDRAVVFPQTHTPAAGGTEYISVDSGDRGFAGQYDLAAFAPESPVVSAIVACRARYLGMPPAWLAGQSIGRGSVYPVSYTHLTLPTKA